MQQEWVLDVRDQCLAAGVPFFFKQWGGVHKKAAGRLLQRRTWDQMPQCQAVRGESQAALGFETLADAVT